MERNLGKKRKKEGNDITEENRIEKKNKTNLNLKLNIIIIIYPRIIMLKQGIIKRIKSLL